MQEIERKWLVDIQTCPVYHPNYVSPVEDIWEITQGYLNSLNDEWLVRVRSINDEMFHLELKSKGLLTREEIKFNISEKEFNETLEKCLKVLKKTRYIHRIPGATFEIDAYEDYKFVTCEVEFKSEDRAKRFKAPEWCIKEITMDPLYKNINLAVVGNNKMI
jgi:CYTH domain-containing protein